MTIATIDIDLTKHSFAMHGVNATDKAEPDRPNLAQVNLRELIASHPATSHWHGRVFRRAPRQNHFRHSPNQMT